MPKKSKPDAQQSNTLTDVSSSILNEVLKHQHRILERYNELAKNTPLNPIYMSSDFTGRALRTHTSVMELNDAFTYYNEDGANGRSSLIYAGVHVAQDKVMSALVDSAFAAGLGPELMLELSTPAAVLLSIININDALYPEYDSIYQEDNDWLHSYSPEQQIEINQIREADSMPIPGVYVTPEFVHANAEAVHVFKQSVGKKSDDLAHQITTGIVDTLDYLSQKIDTINQRSSELGTDPLRHPFNFIFNSMSNSHAIGDLIKDAHENSDLSASQCAAMVSQRLLADSPLARCLPSSGEVKLTQKQIDEIAAVIDKKISENPVLKALQKQLSSQQTMADRLEKIRKEKLNREGIMGALQLGGTIAQLGALVNSPVLYKTGVVFQNSVKIVTGLQQLGILSNLEIFQDIAKLNIGPISTIASAVVGIISLFHKTGPTPDQIIIDQLKQVQTGVNKIMQNQQVILQAVTGSYINLLKALDTGFSNLAKLVDTEIHAVENEIAQLEAQTREYAREIITEVKSVKLAVDQMRLMSLKNAIDFSKNWSARYRRPLGSEFRAELVKSMQTLEEWGYLFACDPSFTGDDESGSIVIDGYQQTVSRHFGEKIGRYDILIQTGYLLKVLMLLVPKLENVDVQTCNMYLWSQAILAYSALVPISTQFGYDPKSELATDIAAPIKEVKRLVKLFQQHAPEVLGALQVGMVEDLKGIARVASGQLGEIRVGLLEVQKRKMGEQQQLFHNFRDNMPETKSKYFVLKKSILVESIRAYVDTYDQRALTQGFSMEGPFNTIVKGESLFSSEQPFHEVSTPVITTFLFLQDPSYRFPSALIEAELLSVGNITATFAYAAKEWQVGKTLTCNAELSFAYVNGTSFKIAEVTWSANLDGNRELANKAATVVLNSLPLYPWLNDKCTVLTVGRPLSCITWKYHQNQLLDESSEAIISVSKANQLAMLEKINQHRLAEQLTSDKSEIKNYYRSIEAKWRLYKAFSLAIGVDHALTQQMNDLDLYQALHDALDAVYGYDLVAGVEQPAIEPALMQVFANMTDLVYQDVQRKVNSSGVSFDSSLSDFVDVVVNKAAIIFQMKHIYQAAIFPTQLAQYQASQPLLNDTVQYAKLETRSEEHALSFATVKNMQVKADSVQVPLHTQPISKHSDPGFTWPSFLLGLVTPPIAYALIVYCANRNSPYGRYYRAGFVLPFFQHHAQATEFSILTHSHVSDNSAAIQNSVSGINHFAVVQVENSALQQLSNLRQFNQSYYEGYWDSSFRTDAYTGEPIFTYRVFADGVEIGGADFYKHPLLCRSESADRHNVVSTHGVLSQIEIGSNLADVPEICEALPPTQVDKFSDGLMQGAGHGAIRKLSTEAKASLQKLGFSQQVAERVRLLFYYSGVFVTTAISHYNQDEDNIDESARVYTAAQNAMFDTARLAATSFVLSRVLNTVSWMSRKAANNGWTRTASVLNKVAGYGGYSIFAYNSYQNSVAHAAGAVAGGLAAEGAIDVILHGLPQSRLQ